MNIQNTQLSPHIDHKVVQCPGQSICQSVCRSKHSLCQHNHRSKISSFSLFLSPSLHFSAVNLQLPPNHLHQPPFTLKIFKIFILHHQPGESWTSGQSTIFLYLDWDSIESWVYSDQPPGWYSTKSTVDSMESRVDTIESPLHLT